AVERNEPGVRGEPAVLLELPVLAVHRHEVTRADELEHRPELAPVGVAGDVDAGAAPVVDLGAALGEPVQKRVHAALVPRDDARRQDDRVALADRELLVLAVGEAGERGGRLALRARDEDGRRARVEPAGLVEADQPARRDFEVPEFAREADRVLEAAPGDRDPAAGAEARVDDLLDAVEVRRERRQEHAAARSADQLLDARPDVALGAALALVLDVRRVGEQEQNAPASDLLDTREVRGPAVDRPRGDLEVAAVEDRPLRRVDRLDRERADREALAGRDRLDRDRDAVPPELLLRERGGEARAENGYGHL